jgi:hypothetical protein
MTGTVSEAIFGTPAEKILRRLRFFDRVASFDLMLALGVSEDRRERDCYSSALNRLVSEGKIKKYVRKGSPTLYELGR